MEMTWRRHFDNITSPPEPEWNFRRMREDVCQYAQQVLVRFTAYPHTARELGYLFSSLECNLSIIINWEGRDPFVLNFGGRPILQSRQKSVHQAIESYNENIEELSRIFEVTDTGVLEEVRDQLVSWLDRHGPVPETPQTGGPTHYLPI